MSNFKRVFTTVSKLNKTVNILQGGNSSPAAAFHVSISDLNGLVPPEVADRAANALNLKAKPTATIALCSNLTTRTAAPAGKPFGAQAHSTMLLEHDGVKIGFMALYDQEFFQKLRASSSSSSSANVEYLDFVSEASRLSKQLRLNGANLVVVLANLESEEASEASLLNDYSSDIDVIFSGSSRSNQIAFKNNGHRWLVRNASHADSLCLVRIKFDETKRTVPSDLTITKYFVE